MSADGFELFVEEDGDVVHVYDDALVGLVGGEARTARASHVEPSGDGWQADMGPVGGPVLTDGGRPFATRAAALEAERAWLSQAMNHGKVSVR